MLYTYHVDIGRMLAFDMDFAMQRVRDLKKEIERTCNIPYVNLVLFVSGGQIMDGKRVVGSYQAGTDNNPIWLVDNRTYNQNQSPRAYIPASPDERLQGYMENSMNLPPTYETIVTRAQLAMSFHEVSRDELKICEGLVKDQHFQHQGWAALKCTLEDKGIALEKNKNRFLKIYNQFLAERKDALVHLAEYDKTNSLIRKIPIPKCLDHYAKKCADRLMRDSATMTSAFERKISNFVSCVDKLEKSEFTSSSGSGPPSGKFMEASAGSSDEQFNSSEPSKPHTRYASDIPELPPLEEVEGNGFGAALPATSPVQIRKSSVGGGAQNKTLRSSDSGVRLKRGEQQVAGNGFTSPGAQSPQSNPGTPKRLSYADDTVDDKRLGYQQQVGVSAGSQEKIIRFEISPTTSVTSQSSVPGSRSDSPAPQTGRRMLSDWIRGNDTKDPIEAVKRELEEKFERLTPALSTEILSKCEEVQKSLDNKSMKEFKGLDKRLAGLEQLMMQMREIVGHQSDMAQGFIQNQQRAKSERDRSILPDLCISHKKQLQVMLEKHQKVCDILRRISNAKQELCTVMHTRIRWIMHMEERLREVDNEVVMTQGMVSRMFSYMKTIRQVHETPTLFAKAIIEGFRRHRFSVRFMEWAGSWAEENSSLYQKEIERRNEFNQHLSGHFLLRIFTGYGETPPQFATTAPDPFDTELPSITAEDIQNLKREVPEISHLLLIPEDPELGRRISTNTLRAISSTSMLPFVSGETPLTKTPAAMTTMDQATSYSMTGSDFHLTSAFTDDIVVLNANGEQGVITPSPEHQPKNIGVGTDMQRVNVISSQVKDSELGSEEQAVRSEKERRETELMQSVEVIPEDDGSNEERGTPFTAFKKSVDVKSLSVQEQKSFEEVEGDLAFHSIRSLSLDEAQFVAKSMKSPLSGTSPDLDDYATADFYIDESIPSAMSMSSPDQTIAELHLQLEEKSNELEQREAEVKELQQDSGNYRQKYEHLTNILSVLKQTLHGSGGKPQGFSNLKLDLENLKKQTQEDVNHVKCDITQLSQTLTLLVQRVSECNESLQKECDALVQKSKEETNQAIVMLEESSAVMKEEWQQKVQNAQEELKHEKQNAEKLVSKLKAQLSQHEVVATKLKVKEEEVSALVKDNENLKEEVAGVEQEKAELEGILHVEKELLQTGENRLSLVEEELNKVKENLLALNENNETLIQDLVQTKKLHEKEIEECKQEFEKQLHAQMKLLKAAESDVESYRKLQEDKCALYEEKCKELERAECEHKQSVEKYVNESEEKYRSALDTYEAELQNIRSEMTLEHEVEMEKVKSDLLLEVAEKEQALECVQEELNTLTQQLQQLRQEKETELQLTHQQFQSEKEQMIKILEKDHQGKLDQTVKELKERLGQEEQERLLVALAVKEQELLSAFKSEEEKTLKTVAEEKESEMRKILEDEYLLNLKESLDKQEAELREKFIQEEKVRLLAALQEREQKLKAVYEQEKAVELANAVENREVEVRQELGQQEELRTKKVVHETEMKIRETLTKEEDLRLKVALKQSELNVRSACETEEEERLAKALELKEKNVQAECEEEFNKKLQITMKEHQDVVKKLEEEHQARVEGLRIAQEQELEEQYLQQDTRLEEVRSQMAAEFTEQAQKQQSQAVDSQQEILAALESEKEQELSEMKESLAFDFHKRITQLRANLEIKEQEISELKDSLQTKGEITNKAIQDIKCQYEEKVSELRAKVKQEKQQSLEQMKTSLTAEKQVLFNEALNKVVSDKDKVIEDLKREVMSVQNQLQSMQAERESTGMEQLQSMQAERESTGMEQSGSRQSVSDLQYSGQASAHQSKPTEELVRPGLPVMWSSVMGQSMMSQSVVPISESSSLQERIQHLELELKSKDQEIMKLKSKLDDKMGELSISQDTQNLLKDKISITSCSKGDIVLLCLDEKYEHYVVFTVGATLHFLHSDCLDMLQLRPAPGESRKLWVLAEIVEKEYCQAKKAQNRFKVPMGTKFYRVRCKPWTHPSLTASPSTMQQPQRSQPRATTASPSQTDQSETTTHATPLLTDQSQLVTQNTPPLTEESQPVTQDTPGPEERETDSSGVTEL